MLTCHTASEPEARWLRLHGVIWKRGEGRAQDN